MNLPPDPFGRSNFPTGFTRRDRVKMMREVADALIAGQMPPRAAALFIGSAFDAFLTKGGRCGSLEKIYLRVTPDAGSRDTPAKLAAELAEDADDEADSALPHEVRQAD